MNTTVYILGIVLQAVAAVIALGQVRRAPHKLPWLLIALSSLLIVVRRAETLQEFMRAGRPLAAAEVLTLVVSLLFFLGVLLMSRMFRDFFSSYRALEKSRAALQESESLLRSVVDTTPVDFWACDRQGRFTMENPAVMRRWGSLLGKRPAEADIPQAYRAAWTENQRRAFSGEVVRAEVEYETAGQKRVFQHIIAPIRNDSGICGLVGFDIDITQRKLAEQELQKKNDELVRYNYTVSHELKSPLVTIQSFLGYLEQDFGRAEKLSQDLGYIRSSVAKMDSLLQKLAHLSGIGLEVNPPVRLLLQDIVREAMEELDDQIRASGALINAAPGPLHLYGDRPRLVEVFTNLIANAVKFMGDQPDPRIDIGWEQACGEVRIFVRDNGLGIDPRHRHNLFGLFETLNPEFKGAGIGLAMVKRIVETHGGRVWAESEGLGRGACFWFTLPGKVSSES